MALVVEDGTGLPNANAYIDVAFLRDYYTARGVTLPSDDGALEAAITVATLDYVDFFFKFREKPLNDAQALKAPFERSGFPEAVKRATAVAAYLHTEGLLFVDKSTNLQQGQVKRTRRKLEGLETENEYVEHTGKKVTYYNPEIKILLKPFLKRHCSQLIRT